MPLIYPPLDVVLLYVQAASPSQATLGATNGISQTGASIARSIGPASATSLFALSAQRPDLMGGNLVYWAFGFMTVLSIAASRMLPVEPHARHQSNRFDDVEED